MLLSFFERLREYAVPVSTREILDCLEVFQTRLVLYSLSDFYFLSRTCLVKDEKFYDRFDRAFDDYFSGMDSLPPILAEAEVEAIFTWALESRELGFTPADVQREMAAYKSQLAKRVLEQTAAPSESAGESSEGPSLKEPSTQASTEESGEVSNRPEGSEGEEGQDGKDGESGEEGEKGEKGEQGEQGEQGEEGEEGEDGQKGRGDDGIEGIGSSDKGEQGEKLEQSEDASRRAAKLWQLRRFEDYDEKVELGTRNLKMALRRVRKFARTGAELELDLANTIRNTARNAGLLDIVEVPEKHNAIKVLLFLDVGGSMDDHVELCNQLFSAARYEFKYLESYYFHNFIYESLWLENSRRDDVKVKTWDVLHKFASDYKIIFVGDANMGRHEIAEKGGSVEHFNAEPGQVWMQRLQTQFRKVVWLNPVQEKRWDDSYTTVMIKRILEDQMYPLSVEGIEQAARYLVR